MASEWNSFFILVISVLCNNIEVEIENIVINVKFHGF